LAQFGARAPGWEEQRPHNVVRSSRAALAAQVVKAALRHRTTGHAAEMAFFAVLTLVPSTVAVGSALGLSERFIGHGAVAQAETAAINAIRTLMGPELTNAVVAPFVHAQLSSRRAASRSAASC
jgi:membrane protein